MDHKLLTFKTKDRKPILILMILIKFQKMKSPQALSYLSSSSHISIHLQLLVYDRPFACRSQVFLKFPCDYTWKIVINVISFPIPSLGQAEKECVDDRP